MVAWIKLPKYQCQSRPCSHHLDFVKSPHQALHPAAWGVLAGLESLGGI